MKLLKGAAPAAALMLCIACAPASLQNRGPGAVTTLGEEGATVRVKNHNWADMTVYLVRAGSRTRLGSVTAMRTDVFRIRGEHLRSGADLQLLVDPVGSPSTFTTHNFRVQPGQEVDFTIEKHLPTSSLAVWNR